MLFSIWGYHQCDKCEAYKRGTQAHCYQTYYTIAMAIFTTIMTRNLTMPLMLILSLTLTPTVTLTQTLTLTLRQPRSLTQNSLQKLHDGNRDYYCCQRQKYYHNSDDRCDPVNTRRETICPTQTRVHGEDRRPQDRSRSNCRYFPFRKFVGGCKEMILRDHDKKSDK